MTRQTLNQNDPTRIQELLNAEATVCAQHLGEHDAICHVATTLYRVLAEHQEPVHRVANLLGTFQERVLAHFDDEEAAGLLPEIAEHLPQCTEVINRLAAEHAELRQQLEELVRLVGDAPLTTECWNRLEKDFRTVHDRLMHHEAAENELLQRAYDDDLPAED